MPRPIILDVDTGTDDAIAIMAAALCPELTLTALCTVAGNKPIENTTDNTLRLIDALGISVPVYKGCAMPLVKRLCDNRVTPTHPPVVRDSAGNELHIHPATLNLPAPSSKEQDKPAAIFYVDYLRAATEPVTIVAVGPLTNLAVALRIDPSIADKICELFIMGGGYNVANITPCAEFNIWADPEAAQIVFACGAPIVLVPLDATHQTSLTAADCVTLRGFGNFPGRFAADLAEIRIAAENALLPGNPPNCTPIHDALAVLAVVDMSVLRDVRAVHVDIGLGDFAEGQTIVTVGDRYHNTDAEKNVRFAFGADKDRFFAMLSDCLRRG